jgi:hypothetical protein
VAVTPVLALDASDLVYTSTTNGITCVDRMVRVD